jgi:hypothetical protein
MCVCVYVSVCVCVCVCVLLLLAVLGFELRTPCWLRQPFQPFFFALNILQDEIFELFA